MRKETFELAKSEIAAYLIDNKIGAYTFSDITKIFQSKREEWGIANYRTTKHFISFLEQNKILELIKLKHLTKGNLKQVFIIPNGDKFKIAQTIKKEGYISYYSALQIHQLTFQNSKSVYISFDKYGESENTDYISQESIDNAFSKPQRQTSEIYKSEIDDIRYIFIQKKTNSIDVGISEDNGVKFTDLERTLIDITIRPAYSGGVFEVLEAFIKAKDKVNIIKMMNYLDELNYVYPYHQLIGLYLEKAGYNDEATRPFYKRKMNLKFYLTYNISNKKLDEKWNVYYPNGF
ncbi:MAG: type IV toxin-antitoxin system AbiEi family antitoxin domain-containing protein [Flavobacterium sp.]|uniref:type IV toxin-antitoxin system AbiEi family antitoxin domain-containing protein n=1 Tax=Flavobacterium sp. TaxID=239 RepID=UPI003BC49B06